LKLHKSGNVFIQKVQSSNLSRDIGYPYLAASWFSSVPQGGCRNFIWFRPRRLYS